MYFFNQFSEGNVLLCRMHSLLILVFVFFNLVAFCFRVDSPTAPLKVLFEFSNSEIVI